jgi:hypothetical protein
VAKAASRAVYYGWLTDRICWFLPSCTPTISDLWRDKNGMNQSQQKIKPQFELRIDGMPNLALRFRASFDNADDFDILVEDAGFGPLRGRPALPERWNHIRGPSCCADSALPGRLLFQPDFTGCIGRASESMRGAPH